MLGKLLIIILVVGATASALLVNRQKRIETFHEMSQIHRRLHNHEYNLWKLRMQIAGRCRPAQVRLLVDRMGGEWIPIPAPGSPLMTREDLRLASNTAKAEDAAKLGAKKDSSKTASAKTSSNKNKPAGKKNAGKPSKPPVQVAANSRNRN